MSQRHHRAGEATSKRVKQSEYEAFKRTFGKFGQKSFERGDVNLYETGPAPADTAEKCRMQVQSKHYSPESFFASLITP